MGYGNKDPKVIKIEAGGTDPALRQDVDNLNVKLNENTAQLAQIAANGWKDKTFITLGDSITWQDGNVFGGTSEVAVGYQTIVKNKLGFSSYTNQGVSGSPMADGTTNGSGTVTKGLQQSYTNYDLVIIAAGTNDFKLNVPLGNQGVIGDVAFDRNSFFGAYRTLLEHILANKPTIRVVLFTPLQRDHSGYDVNFVNSSGHKLVDYVNATIKLGEMYGIPVCDMYRNSGFTKMTLSIFTRDGLHPNNVGYARMGQYAVDFMRFMVSPVIIGDSSSPAVPLSVVDTFNRSDNVTSLGVSDSGHSYEIYSGTFGISNNQAYKTTTSTDYAVVNSGIADGYVEVTFTTLANDMRLVFRANAYDRMYVVSKNSSNQYVLMRIDGGAGTTLQTLTATPANGDVIRATFIGDKITISVNGIENAPVTDATYKTATKHGFGGRASTAYRWDDFKVEAAS